jgi:hypothetical protein
MATVTQISDIETAQHVLGMAHRIENSLTLLEECLERFGFMTGTKNVEFCERVEALLKEEGWR